MFAFYCTSNLDHIYFALTKGDEKMKIEDNRNVTRRFSDLEVGDIFTNAAGYYYMKTEKVYSNKNGEISIADEFDAVCLSEGIEGTKTRFKPDEKVILLDDVTLVLN